MQKGDKTDVEERQKLTCMLLRVWQWVWGLIKDTEDLLRFGGVLGAMGAFDDDEGFYKPIDNTYAWRLNCEDGSAYGVAPEDYETRDAYNEALYLAKNMDDAE